MTSGQRNRRKISCCGSSQALNRQKLCLCSCGACCLTGAILTAVFWTSIFLSILSSQFSLSRNSITFNMWKETPLPIFMNVVFFNWTNPENSLRGTEKPVLTEMGPYIFSEVHTKEQIVWNDGNDTITFLNRNQWHFLPGLSNGTLQDIVTNLNPVTLTIGFKCKDLDPDTKALVDQILLSEARLVVSQTVDELIFNGFKDPLLQNEDLKKYVPGFPAYDKFGWYYQRNMSATADGVLTMYTGNKNIERLGLLTSWNYRTTTECYPGECGEVQATIGNVLPLSSFKNNHLTLFNTDICGFYTLDYEKPVELYFLPGIQYQATESMFSNNETCYCLEGVCPAPGVRDISSCKHAPVFVSLPHFLHADESYLQGVSGLSPDTSKHSFFMSLANLTSVPLVVRVRLQTNILMEPIDNMMFFSNLTTTYMPVYWVDQYATLTPDLASLMHRLYTLSTLGGWVILGVVGGLGAVLLLLGIVLRCRDPDQYQVYH